MTKEKAVSNVAYATAICVPSYLNCLQQYLSPGSKLIQESITIRRTRALLWSHLVYIDGTVYFADKWDILWVQVKNLKSNRKRQKRETRYILQEQIKASMSGKVLNTYHNAKTSAKCVLIRPNPMKNIFCYQAI